MGSGSRMRSIPRDSRAGGIDAVHRIAYQNLEEVRDVYLIGFIRNGGVHDGSQYELGSFYYRIIASF